ncbi:MAG: AAA family ATPase [Pirellulaceae bacterium]|jgi:general secretion pathway protein A|nr:AAA family ATPase [Pirellulaceae bacterium]
MYEAYWQLETKPFDGTTDTRFYFPAETHQGALLKLRYAIENRRGAALLTGGSGLGKSLVVQTLLRQLGDCFAPRVPVVFPQMPADQLLAYLAESLAGDAPNGPTPTIAQSVRRLERVLSDNAQAGRHAVLVIDEAQDLVDQNTLETIRLLLNIEHGGVPALTVLLVGQPSLLPVLDRLPELDERLAVKCLLRRLNLEETISYVMHRLQAAGATRAIFDASALEALHHCSAGIPRRINRLGDLGLLIGFAEERASIGREQIEAVAEELVAVVPD